MLMKTNGILFLLIFFPLDVWHTQICHIKLPVICLSRSIKKDFSKQDKGCLYIYVMVDGQLSRLLYLCIHTICFIWQCSRPSIIYTTSKMLPFVILKNLDLYIWQLIHICISILLISLIYKENWIWFNHFHTSKHLFSLHTSRLNIDISRY